MKSRKTRDLTRSHRRLLAEADRLIAVSDVHLARVERVIRAVRRELAS